MAAVSLEGDGVCVCVCVRERERERERMGSLGTNARMTDLDPFAQGKAIKSSFPFSHLDWAH